MHDARRRSNFHWLLGGQFVSDFGGQLTIFALPTIAILTLHASSFNVAALQAGELAVIPLFALLAGFVVDRVRRKPLMMGANAVRLTAIALLPVLAFSGRLSLMWLFVAAIAASIASLAFDTAYQPFLRTLLSGDDYTRGNARMTTGAALAQSAGNAVSGPLVQLAGAPFALLGNVATYVAGTLALSRIDVREERRRPPAAGSAFAEALEGMRLVFGDKVLRNIALSTTILYFGCAIVNGVLALYVYRVLHVSATTYGVLLGISNAGVFGGLLARRAAERAGPRIALAFAVLAIACGHALCLSAAMPLVGIALGRAIVSFAAPVYDVVQQTIVTFRVPESAFGRTCAALRTLTWSSIPIGSLLGGALADRIGPHATIAVGAGVCIAAVAALFKRTRAGRTWSACWPPAATSLQQHSIA